MLIYRDNGGAMSKFKCYVGVPVYNEEKYVEKTLLSLIEQDADDVRFHVSDNFSTDNTWDIINDLCACDRRFFLTRQEKNVGAFVNFKQLYDVADSEYFMWMGAHDYVSSGFIQSAVDVLDAQYEIVMVSGKPYKFSGDGESVFMDDAVYHFTQKRLGRYLQTVRLLSNCTIVYSVFRKNALVDFEFRKTISNDHILLSHLLWRGQLHYLEKECYFRRCFDSERLQTQSQRITGTDEFLSRHDMILYYLDDIHRLFDGDVRILRYLENEIIDALQHRFGVQSLSINDEILLGR